MVEVALTFVLYLTSEPTGHTRYRSCFRLLARSSKNMEKNRWWLAIPFALGVMIVNVLISVLWVAVYSMFINPGQDEAYYQAYAQTSAPYSSIIAGIPLMFLAGRWIGSKFPKNNSVKAALFVWLVYFLIDLAVIVAAGALLDIALLFIISFVTKFAAAYLGGLSAQRRATQ